MSTEDDDYVWTQTCGMRQYVNGQPYTCGWRCEAKDEAEVAALFEKHKVAAHSDGTWENPPRGGWQDRSKDDYE